jgi:hypothetical protein
VIEMPNIFRRYPKSVRRTAQIILAVLALLLFIRVLGGTASEILGGVSYGAPSPTVSAHAENTSEAWDISVAESFIGSIYAFEEGSLSQQIQKGFHPTWASGLTNPGGAYDRLPGTLDSTFALSPMQGGGTAGGGGGTFCGNCTMSAAQASSKPAIDLNPVPLPPALPLFATGLAMLGLLAVRRNAKGRTRLTG